MLIPQYDKTMTECEKYIKNHLDSVSVSALCEHLKVSRTVLYEIFKNKIGMGVSEFIRSKRMEEAKRLLTETDLLVSEISSKCGFSDYNYFGRVFKKTFGQSAKSLRENSRRCI